MFDAIIDPDGNLVIVHFSDTVDQSQSEDCCRLVKSFISKAKPGFTGITDLGLLKHMDFECTPHVSEIMDLFNEALVAKAYHVTPNKEIDIGWNIMSKFHYNNDSVSIKTFPNFFQSMKAVMVDKSF